MLEKFIQWATTLIRRKPSTHISDNAAYRGAVVVPENLGQPFKKDVYARNVWDMQLYGDKIYLGHGNSTNSGPSPSAGVDGIVYYDITSEKFVTHYKLNEEQIDTFMVLDNRLYMPGNDPTESWEYGNFYRFENGTWAKYRNIPNGTHAYGIESFGGNLFVSLGTSGDRNTVLTSYDDGLTWSRLDQDVMGKFTPNGGFAYSLFKFKNKLYAGNLFFNGSNIAFNRLLCIERVFTNGTYQFSSSVITAPSMVPDAEKTAAYKLIKTTVFTDKLLYIAGTSYNAHQTFPYALYCATDINKAVRITLPASTALPMDILVRGTTAYVLAYVRVSSTQFTNIVYTTTDGRTYSELFRFTQDTFARSFEEVSGNFYFGLGCYVDLLPKSTGNILRVKSGTY